MCAPCLERVDLRAVAHAAVDGHRAQAGGAAQMVSASCQTWRASSRVGTRISAWQVGAGWVEPLQHRQQEGAGLAAAGARLDHHVAPGQQVGHGARLHGHEGRPARPGDGLLQGRRKFVDRKVRETRQGFSV